jgi:hypothetical protein
MCTFGGPSSTEEMIAGQESSLASTLRGNYNTVFGEQQDTMKALDSQLRQIRTGQTGLGFSAAEQSVREAQIINQGGANARNAAQAAQDFGAGKTFNGSTDSSGLARQSGINQQIRETAQSQAETQTANQLTNLTAENYGQGRENAARSAAGLATLAGLENPNPAASAAGSELGAAFGSAEKIQQAKIAETQGAIGLATSIGMDAATFGAGTLAGNQGFDLQGGLSALSGRG